MKAKSWGVCFIVTSIIFLSLPAALTIFVDPYFHYHMPISYLSYGFSYRDQRYINDGITRQFDYDAVIIGTSMTENFKATEMDALFGVTSIKIPNSGARYKEINNILERAFHYNAGIRIVVRGLDYNCLLSQKDECTHPESYYPVYLYDDFLFNDVNYILNKDVFWDKTIELIKFTLNEGVSTTFDSYCNATKQFEYSEEAVYRGYTRSERSNESVQITEEEKEIIRGNLNQNVVSLIVEHPETEFYLFFTPYSILYWDSWYQEGTLERQLQIEQVAIEELLPYENIHLFSFYTNVEMICDLNNYKDIGHYSEDVNSDILQWMYDGEYEITTENYSEYLQQMRDFYLNYDYDALMRNLNQKYLENASVEK